MAPSSGDTFARIEKDLETERARIESALRSVLAESPDDPPLRRLRESMAYSLAGGGKRFRPVLALWTAEALKASFDDVFPWAAAVEMIHTYSLIHDDLPCMDDDDVRRGLPTNHKKFGEATALLAGDALLTDAFGWLAKAYSVKPAVAAELVGLLSVAAGSRGMIGGQVLDLAAETDGDSTLAALEKIHDLKTGCLIRVSIEGAAVAAGAPKDTREALIDFGFWLGRAFQIADDLLDAGGAREKGKSYVELLGVDGTRVQLAKASETARAALVKGGLQSSKLAQLIDYNRERRH